MIKRLPNKKKQHKMKELYSDGIGYFIHKDMKRAIENFTAVIKYRGKPPQNGDQLIKLAHYHRAHCYRQIGEHKKAKADDLLGEKPKKETG